MLSGKTFTSNIRPEKRPFYIHTEFACNQSEVLQKMIKGSWKEGHQESVDLPDIEHMVLTLGSQFFYAGYYQAPPRIPTEIAKEELVCKSFTELLASHQISGRHR